MGISSPYRKAALISAAVSLCIVLGQTMLSARATTYAPGVGVDELEGLKYFEAVALLESRAHSTTGLRAILENSGDIWFWQYFFMEWAVQAVICFVCSALVARWVLGSQSGSRSEASQ